MDRAELTEEALRRLTREHCGLDLGDFDAKASLHQMRISGFCYLQVIAAIEEQYDIEFPPDLLSAIETAGDLMHFANVKISQLDERGGFA
jgi:acyl carrier protein